MYCKYFQKQDVWDSFYLHPCNGIQSKRRVSYTEKLLVGLWMRMGQIWAL